MKVACAMLRNVRLARGLTSSSDSQTFLQTKKFKRKLRLIQIGANHDEIFYKIFTVINKKE